eukprot:s2158_g3.t1
MFGSLEPHVVLYVQFDVDASSSCCVPSLLVGDLWLQLGFANPPPSVSGDTVNGPARSPDDAAFSVSGSISSFAGFAGAVLQDSAFPGGKAGGLWSFNLSTDGDDLTVSNGLTNPHLRLRVEPCLR